MSGHNKWTKIKHKKERTDRGKGKLFSRLSRDISIAAKDDPDPKFNPTLRSAIDQAKKQNMPQANIERAITRASEVKDVEELLIEAYAPEGVGILIEASTDNKNRFIAEIKVVFKKYDTNIANPGSLAWAFEKTEDGYTPKFGTEATKEARDKIIALMEELNDIEEVSRVYSALK